MANVTICDVCKTIIEVDETPKEFLMDGMTITLPEDKDFCRICARRAMNKIARQAVEQLTEHRKVKS